MVTSKQPNDQKETQCFGITHERKYYHIEDTNTFVKRSLRPREWQENHAGETIVPRYNRERLLNEAAALRFVAQNTTVPVPKLYACFEDDEAVYLITEYIDGKGMHELEDEQKLLVERELEHYLQQIHELGLGVCRVLARVLRKTFLQKTWTFRRTRW